MTMLQIQPRARRWLSLACTAALAALLVFGALLAGSPAAWAQDGRAVEAVQVPGANVEVPAAGKAPLDNPYGLAALWAQGDFVAKGTLLILVLMSVGSWYILVTKLVSSLRISADARAARKQFFQEVTLHLAVEKLKPGSPFRYIAENGISAYEHDEGTLIESIDRSTWVTMQVQRSVDEVQSRLQDGLAVLATVGSTAPFIGLFGTVWGIYHALTAIGIAGQASIDKVAGPVGEALIMTAIGLAVAVPAVLGYNWLVRRNKVTMDAVRGFSADLHGVLQGLKGP